MTVVSARFSGRSASTKLKHRLGSMSVPLTTGVAAHAVKSRMLCFIEIDLKIAATLAAVEFRSLSFIAINRDSRTRYFLVAGHVSSKCS